MKNIQVIPFLYDDDDDLLSNCYVVVDSRNNCIVIDPSKEYKGIVSFINKNKYKLIGVFLTHTHFDHMGGVETLLSEFNAPLYVGWNDVPGLKDPSINLSSMCGFEMKVEIEPIPVVDSQTFSFLKEEFKIITLPYHTIGSIGIYFPKSKVVFTGDCLFKMSIGRCDFITSCRKEKDSTLAKLMKLDDDVKVYPGHGKFTSIGEERKLNPFIKF